MRRLLLVRHATTVATRRAAFPATTGAAAVDGCEALDTAGMASARRLRAALPRADRCWTSHARRAIDTARALGLAPDPALPELAEGDFGRWAGRTLDEVHAAEPDGLAAWLADPDAAPHGGEPLPLVRQRATQVLGAAAQAPGTTVAVSHGGLIRAAVLAILDLPAQALWRIDCAPASVTELRHGDGAWRLARLNWTPALATRAATADGRPDGAGGAPHDAGDGAPHDAGSATPHRGGAR